MANRFHTVTNNTTDADAGDVNQFSQAFDGTPGEGKPLDMTQLDEDRYYVVVKNLNATSKVLQLLKSDGTLLFECKGSGCLVSPDGSAAAVPVTTGGIQTLTNKTLASPTITGSSARANASHYDATQVNTSSSSYVDTGSQVTLTTTGGNLLVWFTCTVTTGATLGQKGQLALQLETGGVRGADVDGPEDQVYASGDSSAYAFVHRFSGLAAGTYIVRVRIKTLGGSTWRAEDRSLVAMEV